MFLGISMGSTTSGIKVVFQSLIKAKESDPMLDTIIWQIRFPRVLLATLVGAALSLGGLVFQALLRNPLAEPYILGISGGSAIGAIIGILMGFSRFPGVSLTAFAGSIAILLLILVMSLGQTILKKDALLLSGVMVNAFCAAVIMFLVSMTQDSRLHNIIFWLMGSFVGRTWSDVLSTSVIVMPGLLFTLYFARDLNIMALGERTANTLGVESGRVKKMLLVGASLITAICVSVSGIIGFVGLIIPHLLRMILGPDNRILLPACFLGGATLLLGADTITRALLPSEIPIGVLTSLIGGPFFCYIFRKKQLANVS